MIVEFLKFLLAVYVVGFVVSYVFFLSMMLILKQPRFSKMHGIIALAMIWPFMLFGMAYAFARIHKSLNELSNSNELPQRPNS